MVGIAARLVVAVIGHELNHLERALGAGDVRELDVGLPRGHWRLRDGGGGLAFLVVMLEQAVRDDRDLRGALNRRPH